MPLTAVGNVLNFFGFGSSQFSHTVSMAPFDFSGNLLKSSMIVVPVGNCFHSKDIII